METTTSTSERDAVVAALVELAEEGWPDHFGRTSRVYDVVPARNDERYLLVERNSRDGELYLCRFETPERAAEAHDNQEYPEDWYECWIVDLDTGDSSYGTTLTEFGDVKPGAILDSIAETLRETDWSEVLYDGDALRTIAGLVAGTGRDVGPEDGAMPEPEPGR